MSKFMRMWVLVASLVSLLGVMSSSAGAVTWTNDGGHSFTATGGPTTWSGGGLGLGCASSHVTGTMGTNHFVGAVWAAASATARFTGCFVAGVPTVVHCGYRLTATQQLVPNVTNGNLDVTCDWTQGGTKFCHIHGSTPVHYINHPDPRLTMTTTTALRATNGVANCLLGTGATHLTESTLTVTSPNAPTITRRP